MSMSIVGTTSAGQPVGESTVTLTYPAGIQAGDLALVSLTANKNTWNIATPGYSTVTFAEGTSAFRSYLVRRFLTGDETTASFVKNTDTASPLVATMIVIRGVHPDAAIGIQASANAVQAGVTANADPAVDIQVNRAANPSRVIYWRTLRNGTGVNPTFSIGGGTGYTLGSQQYAGTTVGGVRYGATMAYTGDFLGSTGNSFEPSGGIKSTATSTDDVHFMVALLGINEAATASVLPKLGPTALVGQVGTADGDLTSQLPKLTSTFAGTGTPPEGDVEASLPKVSAALSGGGAGGGMVAQLPSLAPAEFAGAVNPIGGFAGQLPSLSSSFLAETAVYGEHVIRVEPDDRAFRVVDDGTDVGLKPIKRSKVTTQ